MCRTTSDSPCMYFSLFLLSPVAFVIHTFTVPSCSRNLHTQPIHRHTYMHTHSHTHKCKHTHSHTHYGHTHTHTPYTHTPWPHTHTHTMASTGGQLGDLFLQLGTEFNLCGKATLRAIVHQNEVGVVGIQKWLLRFLLPLDTVHHWPLPSHLHATKRSYKHASQSSS